MGHPINPFDQLTHVQGRLEEARLEIERLEAHIVHLREVVKDLELHEATLIDEIKKV